MFHLSIRPIRKLRLLWLLFVCITRVAAGQPAGLQTLVQQVWFTTLANKMGLNKDQFELYQGAAPLGSTSQWMWNIFNAIPAKSTDHYYNPAQYNSFSSDYGLVLVSLVGGDANPMLSNAIIMYGLADQKFAWDKTIGNLQSALAAGQQLQLDTTITIIYLADTTSATTDTIGVNIQAQFDKYTVFYSSPYSRPDSLNAGLAAYKPWFCPPVFSVAYNTNDNAVWNSQSPVTWQTAFGPNGFMQNMCIGLVAVDGINIEISFHDPHPSSTSAAVFSNLMANSKCYAPIIYSADSHVSNAGSGTTNLVYSIKSPPGDPLLLGVIVCTMADFAHRAY